MIISKKRYEDLIWIIDKQNTQINELISMVDETRKQLKYALSSYVDLVNAIDIHIFDLPVEAMETIEKLKQLIKDQG